MLVAIGLVYLLLVPVVFFALPLVVIGGFVSLAATGRALGLSALIGLLMLIDIVVTNTMVRHGIAQAQVVRGRIGVRGRLARRAGPVMENGAIGKQVHGCRLTRARPRLRACGWGRERASRPRPPSARVGAARAHTQEELLNEVALLHARIQHFKARLRAGHPDEPRTERTD
jgi:hypothetical protein